MAVDKAALLAAVAQAGSQGKQAYEQAQASMAQQQAEAVRMALASGVAGQANQGAQDELQRIVSQPYQTRAAQLTSNQAAMTDWFNRLGVNAGQWGDVMSGLTEAVAARAAAEAGGGGGGSGGGGSGGGGGDDPFDWEKNLGDLYGTTERGLDVIWDEAKAAGMNSIQNPDLPRYQQTRLLAMNDYGIPEEVAIQEFGPTKAQSIAETVKPTYRNFKSFYMGDSPDTGAVNMPGNQTGPTNTLMRRLPAKAQKRAKELRKKTRRRGR